MSEKLYRIKPLVWEGNSAKTWATDYEIKLCDASKSLFSLSRSTWEKYGGPKTAPISHHRSLEECVAAAQRDYEQRLLSAGVVEEVS